MGQETTPILDDRAIRSIVEEEFSVEDAMDDSNKILETAVKACKKVRYILTGQSNVIGGTND